MVKDVWGLEWSFIRFQKVGLGGEIPRVTFGQSQTDR